MLFSYLLSNKLSRELKLISNQISHLKVFNYWFNKKDFLEYSGSKLKSFVCIVLLNMSLISQAAMPIGSEFQVNSSGSEYQKEGVVTSLNNGGFVIAWTGYPHGGNDHDIFAQRYKFDGSVDGDEFLVNTYTANEQSSPNVTNLSNGGFIIVWQSDAQDGSDSGVFAQRYKADGSIDGAEFQVNTSVTGYQGSATVISINNGDFIISWFSHDQNSEGLFAQRYKVDGSTYGSQFQVISATGNSQGVPTATSLSNDGFAITWSENNSIFVQRYKASGSLDGLALQVTTATQQWSPGAPVISSLDNGDFVIAWRSTNEDWSDSNIFAQRFKADGSPDGNAFQVNTYSSGLQMSPVISTLNNGDFVITWDSFFEGAGVFAQQYNINGSMIGLEFQVNTLSGYNLFPAISSFSNGNFIIIWQALGSNSNINVRRFASPLL